MATTEKCPRVYSRNPVGWKKADIDFQDFFGMYLGLTGPSFSSCPKMSSKALSKKNRSKHPSGHSFPGST